MSTHDAREIPGFKIVTVGTATQKDRFIAGPFQTREQAGKFLKAQQLEDFAHVVRMTKQTQA